MVTNLEALWELCYYLLENQYLLALVHFQSSDWFWITESFHMLIMLVEYLLSQSCNFSELENLDEV